MLSLRAKKISLSPTLKISAKAKAMKSAGVDVIDLSVGEPDFPTPSNIKEAAKKAIDDNFTKYTANNGILSLRQAIAKKLKEENGVEYSPDEIIVSSGAKNCLYNLSMTLFDEGDEVIILAPYWVSYPEMVKLSAAKPVIVSKLPLKNLKELSRRQPKLSFSITLQILLEPHTPKRSFWTWPK
jgi:aspartate aminotransferase